MQVLEVLHKKGVEGCTTSAMNWAAANGYLETVQWLHENRSEVCLAVREMSAFCGHAACFPCFWRRLTDPDEAA